MMWRALGVPPEELRCDVTLTCGQSFRWKAVDPDVWRGVIGSHVVFLYQTPNDVLYYTLSTEDITDLLIDYFQLRVPLAPLYRHWSSKDARFAQLAPAFPGLRVLRIDPVECLFSFLCSSANNIARITRMVNALCAQYGAKIAEVDGEPQYQFPTVETLAQASEAELVVLGFGYRARLVVQAARELCHRGTDWLYDLRSAPYQQAHEALITIPGIGHKIADCICLFALDKPQAIPVDRHIWQIALRYYLPNLQYRSLTKHAYQMVGDCFRERFGAHAGWAHNVLFAAELSAFRHRLRLEG